MAMPQGEAIAFVLGGNRKMLRANSLAVLLNQEVKAAGGRTAQVCDKVAVQVFRTAAASISLYLTAMLSSDAATTHT